LYQAVALLLSTWIVLPFYVRTIGVTRTMALKPFNLQQTEAFLSGGHGKVIRALAKNRAGLT
jgi:hypothetical protein